MLPNGIHTSDELTLFYKYLFVFDGTSEKRRMYFVLFWALHEARDFNY